MTPSNPSMTPDRPMTPPNQQEWILLIGERASEARAARLAELADRLDAERHREVVDKYAPKNRRW